MARQGISTGTTPNDGTGDNLLAGAVKINSNFSEVYGIIGDGTNAYVGIVTQLVAGSNISISTSYGSVTVTGSGSGSVAGIDTLGTSGFSGVVVSGVGTLGVTSTTNLSAQRLNVSGVSTFVGKTEFTTNNVVLTGTNQLKFGGGENTVLYYGTDANSYLQTNLNELLIGGPTVRLQSYGSVGFPGENFLVATKDGSVDLYYDNSKKFETTGAGVTVTGTTFSNELSISGVSTFLDNIDVDGGDITFQSQGDKLKFTTAASDPASGGCIEIQTSATSTATIKGSSNQLLIFNDDNSSNSIDLRAATYTVRDENADYYALFNNGAVNLYHPATAGGILEQKFETTGAGVTVTGTVEANQLNISGISTFNGKTRILDDVEFHVGTNGSSGDYKFYHDSGNSYNVAYEDITGYEARFIGNVSGSGNESNFTFLKSTNTLAKYTQNGILLYANNGERFRTNGDGIIVTGGAVVSGVVTASTLHVGLVTASSTTGVTTYYGDTSNAVDGRWVLSGDGSNYTFTGIGITSGNNTDPILYLARARVYEFVNTQPASHPLVIRDSDGGTEWTAGVSTSTDGTNDILRFEVPMNAPNTLYYQCTVHSGMGNTITVYPTVS